MKFLCANCKAKYQIADDKTLGKTLRMKCRRCAHGITIDGTSSTPDESPPRALDVPAPPAQPSASLRPPSLRPPPLPQSSPPRSPGARWFVAIQGISVGPMTREELGRKIESGAVGSHSLCWRPGFGTWQTLAELSELSEVLQPTGPKLRVSPSADAASAGATTSDHGANALFDDDGSGATRIADLGASDRAQLEAASSALPPQLAPVPLGASLSAIRKHPRRTLERRGAQWGQIGLGLVVGMALMVALRHWTAPLAQRWSQTWHANPAASEQLLSVSPLPLPPRATPRPQATAIVPVAGAQVDVLPTALSDTQAKVSAPAAADDATPPPGTALSAAQLTGVVQSNKAALSRCHEVAVRSLGAEQTDALRLRVTVRVGTDGVVSHVTTSGQGLGGIVECIKQVVKRWRFPAATGESEFEFPLLFVSSREL